MTVAEHEQSPSINEVITMTGETRDPARGGSAPDHRQRLGRFGESLAARFLRERGVRILDRNVRLGRGEIDLHVDVEGTSVAVEVKTILARGSDDDAVYQFSPKKADTVRRHAARLVPPARRVDLVTVTFRTAGADIRWVPFAA